MIRASPNRPLLLATQTLLGETLGDFVLVGGSVVDLLLTDPTAPEVRGTEDVDLLIEVATRLELHDVERSLGRRGLLQPMTGDVPICRWCKGDLTLDVMPTDPSLYGFGNRWASVAVETARLYHDEELTIRHVVALVFVALKIEVYRSPERRNGGDPYASHDLGDIIAVLDGCREIVPEIRGVASEVRREIIGFAADLDGESLEEVIESHLLEAWSHHAGGSDIRQIAGL